MQRGVKSNAVHKGTTTHCGQRESMTKGHIQQLAHISRRVGVIQNSSAALGLTFMMATAGAAAEISEVEDRY
jgi:hypothetical protein